MISIIDTGQCFTQITCSAYSSLGLWYTSASTGLDTGPPTSGIPGLQKQRAGRFPCVPPNCPPPANDRQERMKAHLFYSGQDNSEVFTSTLSIQEVAKPPQRRAPGLESVLYPPRPLTSFFWEPFSINHLHRQSLSWPIGERQIYNLYCFGLWGSVQIIHAKQDKTNKSKALLQGAPQSRAKVKR